MKDLISKCGFNCGRCPSYKENLQTEEDRQKCSDGWAKYHGFRLSPDKLRSCDGCQAPEDENPVRYISCYVRRCAVRNGIDTCAHCSGYPCEDVQKVSLSIDSRDKITARLGIPIPEQEYYTYIEPYEGIKHLDEIRAYLSSEEIVEMTKVSVKAKIVDFPNNLPFSTEETLAFATLHRLITALETVHGVSYARQEVIMKRRRHLLKILWAFGLFGELKEEDGSHLVIDSATYLAQKIHSDYSMLKEYFKILGKYGVHCEHVPLAEEGWLTPKGVLRKGGWFMKMSFVGDVGGVFVIKALKKYTAILNEKYSTSAFRYFTMADMRIL